MREYIMFRELPILVIFSYTIFSIFKFYQALHVKNFRGGSEAASLVISISAFSAMIFGYGYLLYYGYAVAWYWPIVIFVIAMILKTLWFFIEAKLKLSNHVAWVSLSGFVVLPLTAYLLVESMP